MSDHELEQRLVLLRPRPAPGELRGKILAKLTEAELTSCPKSRLETFVNVAIAASILIAAGLWYISLHVQPQRIAALLGPSPAQRQADKALQIMAVSEDDPQRRDMQKFLYAQFQRSASRNGQRPPLHSAVNVELFSIAKRNPNEVEANLKNRAPRDGDRSDRRRRPAMVVSVTA